MIQIEQLKAGDEIQCFMRLGIGLEPIRTKDKKPYYKVPSKGKKARITTVTRFFAWVVRNDTTKKVLTLEINSYNSWRRPTLDARGQVEIHYSSFKKVRKFSKVAFPAIKQIPASFSKLPYRRPGSIAAFGGTDFRPYRTLVDVKI